MPKKSINRDNKLVPTRNSKSYDPFRGIRLGKAAVSANDFPRFKNFEDRDGYTFRLHTHLLSVSLQLMNEAKRVQTLDMSGHSARYSGSMTSLTLHELTEALTEYVDYAEMDIVAWGEEQDGLRSRQLSQARMERAVSVAAAFAHEAWDEHWEALHRRRSSQGGKTSKRGPSCTLEAVAALYDLTDGLPEHKHASTIAAHLPYDVKTVRRRLNELKELLTSYVRSGSLSDLRDGDNDVAALTAEEVALTPTVELDLFQVGTVRQLDHVISVGGLVGHLDFASVEDAGDEEQNCSGRHTATVSERSSTSNEIAESIAFDFQSYLAEVQAEKAARAILAIGQLLDEWDN